MGIPPGMKRWLAGSLALLAAAGAFSQGARPPPGVIVTEAEMRRFPLAVESLGTAAANEAVEIRPQISSVLKAIYFEGGQNVEVGTVLAELENAQPLAELAAAKATLVETESQYRRLQQLFKTQAVAESQLQQLEAQREADRAAVTAAEAHLEDTIISAPFSGRLGLRRVSVGSLVDPGTVITTLDDTASIKLDFSVPEVHLSRLKPGLFIIAQSAAWPGVEFYGTVSSVDSRVDPVSRTVGVRSLLPNPEGRLRAGMLLTVRLMQENIEALMVPEQALVPERSTQSVLVVGADSIVEQRIVKIGRRRPGEVEIVEGLAAGERVIVEGTQKARDGQEVTILEQRGFSQ